MPRGDERVSNPDLAGYARANRDEVYRMITGHDPNSVPELVRIAARSVGVPPGASKAAIARAIAPIVGRAPRTVERWITQTGRQRIRAPQPDALNALRTVADRVRATPQGRRQILGTRRESLMRSRGMRMSGTAVCGPLSAEAQYRRKRRFDDYHIDSEVAGNTIDAWLANGEDAAYNAFNQGFARAYGLTGWDEEETEPDWVFEDMSGLDFRADMTS